ncbi:MAG: YjgP/YjgQ family permease, partial [Acidobacteria bacterium]|nr:YjgP/YjgQ family permease [Acidobacteriota bacterium]
TLSAAQTWVLAGKLPSAGNMWLSCAISLLALIGFWYLQPHIKNYLNRITREIPQYTPADKTNTRAAAAPSSASKLTSLFNLINYLLLSEVVKYFAVALGILVGTVLLFTLLDISSSLSKNNIKVNYALGYLFLLSPQMIYYFAPFAVMLALVVTAAALARTGQLGVLFYYTQNLPRLFVSMLLFSLLVLGGMHFLAEVILPTTNSEQDDRFRRIKGRTGGDITSAIAFDRKWVLDQNENVAGFKVTNPGQRAEQFDVLKLQLKEENHYLQEILAYPQASADADKMLSGTPSFTYTTDAAGLARLQTAPAQPSSLNLTTDVLFKAPAFEASKMSLAQLKQYIRDVERVGLSVTSLKMDKAQRLTFPVACLSLACLAFPLAFAQIRRSQRGGLLMVGIGIVLALCFWAALSLFETAGKNGLIPIDLAAWAPHGLFISLAAVLHARLNAT